MASPRSFARERPRIGRRKSRYQRAADAGGVLIEGRAEVVQSGARNATALARGQRIFHQKFGYGRVTAVDGDRLEIDFDKAGVKKVIASFVEPA